MGRRKENKINPGHSSAKKISLFEPINAFYIILCQCTVPASLCLWFQERVFLVDELLQLSLVGRAVRVIILGTRLFKYPLINFFKVS